MVPISFGDPGRLLCGPYATMRGTIRRQSERFYAQIVTKLSPLNLGEAENLSLASSFAKAYGFPASVGTPSAVDRERMAVHKAAL